MEFYNKLKQWQKMAVIFLALFVCLALYEVVLAQLGSEPLEWEKHIAQGFYYAAIAFAVYHLFTRNKQQKAAAKKAATEEGESAPDAEMAVETEEKPRE